ncbi:MAG: SdpI family protein [Bacteroidota bacterium]
MKWSLKRELIPLLIFLIFGGIMVYCFPTIPDPMTSHFDIAGKPNAWMAKNIFLMLAIGIMLGIYLMLTFIPFIDPLWKKIEYKYTLILLLRDITLGAFAFIFVLTLVAAHEGKLRIDLLGTAIGLLLLIYGNYLPKLPRNWFIGIKTPWTLSSEIDWKKTHIVGGWLFAITGGVIIVLSLLKVSLIIALSILLPVTLVSILIYPFYIFKKQQKEKEL